MKEKEEQRYGRDKDTSVDKGYLESGEFRRKFDKISDSKKLNRLLYQLAKKMLIHRSGTKFEDMYWIDPILCEVVASECTSTIEEKVVYSEKTIREIRGRDDLITIHSHPSGFPPSVEDLNSNHTHSYIKGIVVTHRCSVFVYGSRAYIDPVYYRLKLDSLLLSGYNEFEAQIRTLSFFQEHSDVFFKEVTGNDD